MVMPVHFFVSKPSSGPGRPGRVFYNSYIVYYIGPIYVYSYVFFSSSRPGPVPCCVSCCGGPIAIAPKPGTLPVLPSLCLCDDALTLHTTPCALCGKQWQSIVRTASVGHSQTVPVRGASSGGTAGGTQRRGAAGTVPEQRVQGALRPARAQRADRVNPQRRSKEKNQKANAA